MNTTEKLAEALRKLLAKNERFSGGTWDTARAALAAWDAERAAPAEPVEPTIDQEVAGRDSMRHHSTLGEACRVYKAMLAAAPKRPAPSEDGWQMCQDDTCNWMGACQRKPACHRGAPPQAQGEKL